MGSEISKTIFTYLYLHTMDMGSDILETIYTYLA